MKITVAICTWNRCALLKETLEQVARLAIPSEVDWQLLVVNNNSTDATSQVLASFDSRLPLHSVLEPNPGLSNARNRAVVEATGDYILWTDDDVLVDEGWLTAYCEAFVRWSEAAIFGGNIKPWFEGSPPTWLERVWPQVASAYASRDLGEQSVPLSHTVLPFGANFAVRTNEQRKYPYDPQLGVRPDSIIGGEETTVIRSMMADGIKGRWVPDARVRHYIPASRQTILYLRNYFRGYGEYCAFQNTSSSEPAIFGAPRWLWREAVAREARYRLRRHFAQPEVWIEDLIASSQAWGQLRGFRSNRTGVEGKQRVKEVKNEMI
jgi:glycosyltransferase involved in cell wall biosynthesis